MMTLQNTRVDITGCVYIVYEVTNHVFVEILITVGFGF